MPVTDNNVPDQVIPDITRFGPPPKPAAVTAACIGLAEKMAQHTRMNTDELTKIIAAIHQANR